MKLSAIRKQLESILTRNAAFIEPMECHRFISEEIYFVSARYTASPSGTERSSTFRSVRPAPHAPAQSRDVAFYESMFFGLGVGDWRLAATLLAVNLLADALRGLTVEPQAAIGVPIVAAILLFLARSPLRRWCALA